MFRIKGYTGNMDNMVEPEWVRRDAPIDNDIADLTWAAHECEDTQPKKRTKLVARVRPTF